VRRTGYSAKTLVIRDSTSNEFMRVNDTSQRELVGATVQSASCQTATRWSGSGSGRMRSMKRSSTCSDMS
jgi:hypothetical protein